MDFLGVGPLELAFILLIALLVLGPREIARFARSVGRFLNRLYRSEVWDTLSRASQEFRNLPNRLAREAALEELDETLHKEPQGSGDRGNQGEPMDAWRPTPKSRRPPAAEETEEEPSAEADKTDDAANG